MISVAILVAAIAYQRMPVERYLMSRGAEIALARSAAPPAIAKDATVLVLDRNGYEVAIRGGNGFVCMVERGWIGALDWPEMWNPKVRGADCLNPPAARSLVPLIDMKTKMFLAGKSSADVYRALEAAYDNHQLGPLEPGAMSFMMGKQSYLTDAGTRHNMSHVMFYTRLQDGTASGANLPGSPVGSGSYWFFSKNTAALGVPAIFVLTVSVPRWSDGTLVYGSE